MDYDYGLLIPFGILLTIIALVVRENIRLGDRNAELRVELARERERATQLSELRAALQKEAAPSAPLTDEDIERQYKDGIHIGSGLPRATCPCGFCTKHRTPASQAAEGERNHG